MTGAIIQPSVMRVEVGEFLECSAEPRRAGVIRAKS